MQAEAETVKAQSVQVVAAEPTESVYEALARMLGEAMPVLVENRLLNNTWAAWIVALVAVAAIFTVLTFVRLIVLARATRFAQRKHSPGINLVVRLVMKTSNLIIAAIALAAGLRGLNLPPGMARAADLIVIALVGIQAAIWATVVVDWALVLALSYHTKQSAEAAEKASRTSMVAVRFLVLLAVYALIVLIAMDNFGIDVTALIAGMGIGGIAVALASQKILGDLFGSLSITLDKPFEVGDFIVVGSEQGTVEVIGIKTTRLRALSGEQLVLSNGDLLQSRIQNFKRMQERRAVFTIGVSYETPLPKVQALPEVIREIVARQKDARFDRAHWLKFGESSLEFEVVYFMTNPDYNIYADTQQAINLEIARRFASMGVDFAYRTQIVQLMRRPPKALSEPDA